MKRLALYTCIAFLAAALLLAAGRHDQRTVHQLVFSYSGLAGLCAIEKRKKKVTDRQHRRRARGCIDKEQVKRCAFCGSKRNLRIHHLNGIESDNDSNNLVWACHACNTRIGWLLKRHNIGRRVDLEYNPAQPARTLAQWVMAVKSMHGESDELTPRQAIAIIRATSPARRSSFAEQIWKIRRARGTDRTAVPF